MEIRKNIDVAVVFQVTTVFNLYETGNESTVIYCREKISEKQG